jgi:HEAT repeat protein
VLGRVGGPDAAATLAGMTADALPEVRLAAASALGELDDPAGLPVLWRLRADPDPGVRSAAEIAVRRLRGGDRWRGA